MALKEFILKAMKNVDKIRSIVLTIISIVYAVFLMWFFVEDWRTTLAAVLVVGLVSLVSFVLIIFAIAPFFRWWELRSLQRALRKMDRSSDALHASMQRFAASMGVTDEDDDYQN